MTCFERASRAANLHPENASPLHRDFTIDEDEITPSLKVKRKNIDKKYKNVIDQMYV